MNIIRRPGIILALCGCFIASDNLQAFFKAEPGRVGLSVDFASCALSDRLFSFDQEGVSFRRARARIYRRATDDQEAKTPKPYHRNAYRNALNHLLDGPYVTEASRYRRKKLGAIGIKIERYIQQYFHSDAVRIAIVPLGSSLKGYANDGSDIDFMILILSGLPNEPDTFDEKVAEQIYEQANVWIKDGEDDGFHVDGELHEQAGIYNFSNGVRDHVSREDWRVEKLFLPVVYGDTTLLQAARTDAIRSVSDSESPNNEWEYLRRQYYRANLYLHAGEIQNKGSILKWLMRYASSFGLDFSLFDKAFAIEGLHGSKTVAEIEKIADAFNDFRRRTVGLAVWDSIAGVFLKRGKGIDSPLPLALEFQLKNRSA